MSKEEAAAQQKEQQRIEKLETNLDRRDRAFKIEGLPETKITSDVLRSAGRRQKGRGR